jgi:hypothetical protein
MPRAVFPALATTVFGGGASTLGFLYAAPGAGALVGAVTTGWVHRASLKAYAEPGNATGSRPCPPNASLCALQPTFASRPAIA